jgi:hypothetical protein
MVVEVNTMWRQWGRAIKLGVLITAITFFVFIIGDLFTSHSDLPVLRRGLYVWPFYWPTIFWSRGDTPKNADDIATFLINVFTYSVIVYVVLRLMKKHS